MSDVAPGQRFTHVYGDRSVARTDSATWRRRLAAWLENLVKGSRRTALRRSDLVHEFNRELGVDVPKWDFPTLFATAHINVVLDAITVVYRWLREASQNNRAAMWLIFVHRVCEEENVGYRPDVAGGMRFHVDQQFAAAEVATIQALSGPRFGAVKNSFEASLRYLDENPPNTRGAVLASFDAVEGLAKLIDPDLSRLTAGNVNGSIKPIVLRPHELDAAAKPAANEMMNGLATWANAGNIYRHAPGGEVPLPPPLDVAVAFVSASTTYLRWLAPFAIQSASNS